MDILLMIVAFLVLGLLVTLYALVDDKGEKAVLLTGSFVSLGCGVVFLLLALGY